MDTLTTTQTTQLKHTHMKKRVITLMAVALTLGATTFAQEAEVAAVTEVTEAPAEATSGELSISGSVDVYTRSVIGADVQQAPGSSFATGQGTGLGMANVVFEKSGEKAGFVADLAFGPKATQAILDTRDNLLNQAYVYWNATDKLTVTMGKFYTFLGYEVISPTGNFNYTTSYLFSYGPFHQTGIKLDYSITDELSIMGGVFNQTDVTSDNLNTDPYFGGQIGYKNDMGGLWLNAIYGNNLEDTTNGVIAGKGLQLDITTGWDLTDALYVGLNASTQSFKADAEGSKKSSFSGAALYIQYALSDNFKLGFRGEQFEVKNFHLDPSDTKISLNSEGNGSVTDLTLSGNITIGDLTLIPEFRVDMVKDQGKGTEPYTTKGKTDGTNILPQLLLAAVYKF